ncbi:hypothetical protein [Roseibium sp. SCP14]|uniref:hypothetical protein n=1 Tax=Roseibium sp. SCP14 TaxID=3141375 RepID=UPI003335FBC7
MNVQLDRMFRQGKAVRDVLVLIAFGNQMENFRLALRELFAQSGMGIEAPLICRLINLRIRIGGMHELDGVGRQVMSTVQHEPDRTEPQIHSQVHLQDAFDQAVLKILSNDLRKGVIVIYQKTQICIRKVSPQACNHVFAFCSETIVDQEEALCELGLFFGPVQIALVANSNKTAVIDFAVNAVFEFFGKFISSADIINRVFFVIIDAAHVENTSIEQMKK